MIAASAAKEFNRFALRKKERRGKEGRKEGGHTLVQSVHVEQTCSFKRIVCVLVGHGQCHARFHAVHLSLKRFAFVTIVNHRQLHNQQLLCMYSQHSNNDATCNLMHIYWQAVGLVVAVVVGMHYL